jgi:hypothetical protein
MIVCVSQPTSYGAAYGGRKPHPEEDDETAEEPPEEEDKGKGNGGEKGPHVLFKVRRCCLRSAGAV